MYGKSRLGQDLFLGEVLVPLREVESTAANHSHDVRRYTLGRRSAKEKVSGEISLECSWRVTPLDVVTLKVRRPCFICHAIVEPAGSGPHAVLFASF